MKKVTTLRSSHVAVGLLVWLALAIAVGASGALAGLRPPMPQLLLLTLTNVLVLSGVFVAPFRQWLRTVYLRAVVALHLTRFVGAYFLYLYERGELPYAFAVPGGIGDIIVAFTASILLLAAPSSGPLRRRLYFAWNCLGLLDIVGVVLSAATQALTDPESMAALLRLPLSLLITFLVPLIIASHLLLVVRLWNHRAFAESP